jgi:WD40 repeat protein
VILAIGLQNFPVLAVNESCTRLVISTKKSNDTYAVEEYDFHSGKLVRSIDCHSGWITCLQFLNDNHVVTGSQGTPPYIPRHTPPHS